VYAASLGDPDGAVLAAGNPALGHDLGLLVNHEELRLRAPWSMPVEQAGPGVPWHITGSLLGLDVGLASLARKQIASDRMPLAPRLDDNELRAFNEAIVLTNAHELTDRDRDATLAAIAKGRQRLLSAIRDPGAIDELMADPRIDEWRARALPWLAREEPDRIPEWFSLAELFWLGSEASLPGAAPDAWGPSARSANGCLCTQFPRLQSWESATGREGAAFVAARFADLKLRIAEVLAALRLPSALLPGVLAAVTDDFVSEAAPIHRDDWLTMVRQAQQIPQSRIEDCVAALTAGGPLIPIRTGAAETKTGQPGARGPR
ncbi:MAG: hypothetical protein IMZ67_09235, partial [Acidobacteria bacterium]|nr:hypothetical protein [Acidobacteriota bacterium]